MSKNKIAILKFFKERPVTVQNVITCATTIYEFRNYEVQIILSTNYLEKIVNEVLTVVKASVAIRKSVHNSLFDIFMSYRIKNNSEVAHAPSVDPVKMREAIRGLFFVRHTKRKVVFSLEKLLRNKISALHALFCSVTGRRWVDITRLRWETMRIKNAPDRMKIKFHLPGSKANPKGKRNEGVSLVQDFSDLCPIALLIEYWILMGRPKFGFIFPCLHKNVTFVTDCVDTWESYRCKGHRSGSKMRPCLGQLNGETSWGTFRNAAKQAGCKVIPNRNSFRRLGCIIAHKFGLNRDQITNTFGWRFDSVMPNHYLQDQLALDDDGFATKLAKSIQKDPNFKFMRDLEFL